jgi:hypothetical protein
MVPRGLAGDVAQQRHHSANLLAFSLILAPLPIGRGVLKKLRAGNGVGAEWDAEDLMTAMGQIAGRC